MRAKEIDYSSLRGLFRQWREISPNYYGDFYPLTSWSRADDTWMAWQFDRPEAGEGMIQVFRRPSSPYVSARYRLHGLEARLRYTVTKLASPQTVRDYTGEELMAKGLPVAIDEKPGADVFVYRKVK